MQDLAGRTAFVTGGANGIGLGLVRALLAEGCKVALADIRQDAIDAALATLDNQDVIGVQLDVASRDIDPRQSGRDRRAARCRVARHRPSTIRT